MPDQGGPAEPGKQRPKPAPTPDLPATGELDLNELWLAEARATGRSTAAGEPRRRRTGGTGRRRAGVSERRGRPGRRRFGRR